MLAPVIVYFLSFIMKINTTFQTLLGGLSPGFDEKGALSQRFISALFQIINLRILSKGSNLQSLVNIHD